MRGNWVAACFAFWRLEAHLLGRIVQKHFCFGLQLLTEKEHNLDHAATSAVFPYSSENLFELCFAQIKVMHSGLEIDGRNDALFLHSAHNQISKHNSLGWMGKI